VTRAGRPFARRAPENHDEDRDQEAEAHARRTVRRRHPALQGARRRRQVQAEARDARGPAPTEPAYLPPADGAPAPGTEPFATLQDLGATWIAYLKANDAAVSTWASYQSDFETAVEHFGATTDPATLTPEAVAAYEQSDAVMKTKKGRAKAMPTILKTRRVLRLALKWAHDAGRLATVPYAAKAAS
jgi:hypothetical protein